MQCKCAFRWCRENITQNDTEPSWGIWSNTWFGYMFWFTLHGVHWVWLYSIKFSNRSAEQRSCVVVLNANRVLIVLRTATENQCSSSDFKLHTRPSLHLLSGSQQRSEAPPNYSKQQSSRGDALIQFHSVQWRDGSIEWNKWETNIHRKNFPTIWKWRINTIFPVKQPTYRSSFHCTDDHLSCRMKSP